MTWKNALSAALVVGLGAGLAACSSGDGLGLEPTDRTVFMAAIEPKGTTNIDKEPFPTEPLPGGGGYALKPVNKDGNWTVETYRFLPNQVVVTEGDNVTLEILGVNGSLHPIAIEGYDLSFDVTRGNLTTVNFLADTAGVFKIMCAVHQPSMTGELIVLPSGA